MAWGELYIEGTVSTVVSPDRTDIIVGNGTLWTTAVVAGDSFEAAGEKVTILDVIDDETLRLAYPWPGSALVDASYVIIQDARTRVEMVTLASSISETVERYRTLFNHNTPTFSIEEFGVNTPPIDYSVDDMLVVGSSPSVGVFSGHSNDIAAKTENGWAFLTPSHGWFIISKVDGGGTHVARLWTGTEWEASAGLAFAPSFQGDWSSLTAYVIGNVVRRLNKLYVAMTASTNFAPESNSDKWGVLVTLGANGGAFTLEYTFKTSTTPTIANTDGQINADAALDGAVTKIRVNKKDINGTDFSTALATIASASTSSKKGKIRLVVVGDPTKQFWADVTASAVVSQVSPSVILRYDLTITTPLSFGTIADGASILFMFSPMGDKGETGPTGPIGPTGKHGGPFAINYLFSTTTGDADPTAGYIRLGSAMENVSTVLRASNTNASGSTVSALIDALTAGTGTNIGVGRLVHADTPDTKWLSFYITAVATPSGYRNVTIAMIASSASNPFALNDPVVFHFMPLVQGGQGDPGIQGAQGEAFSPQYVVATLDLRDAYDAGPAVDIDGRRLSVLVEQDSSNSNRPTLYFLLTAGGPSPDVSALWSQGFDFAPGNASDQVEYDNSTSGAAATNVKDALDEVFAKAGRIELPEEDVASAATTDIGNNSTNSIRVRITGTTTITSFGSAANKYRIVRYNAVLSLTCNTTSLILLGRNNAETRTTATGDIGVYASDASGNWRELHYARANTPPGEFGAPETTVASATTCDIGATNSEQVVISGTTTITSFGTRTNRKRFVRFTGALTLTHNATSLILLGGANRTTAAGDEAIYRSDTSGNWREISYFRAASFVDPVSVAFTPTVTLTGGVGNTVPVYSTNSGRYTRIGSRVFVDVYLSGDGGAEGAGTGTINVALPIAASASFQGDTIPGGSARNGAAEYNLQVDIEPSATTALLTYFDTATNRSTFTGALQNDTLRFIRLSFNYEV